MAIAYDGINYFPVGVNFMEENAMEVIEAKYGIKGSAIVLKLLCKIYKEGYFIRWDEEQCLIFANKAGREVQAAEVQGIIEILFIKGIMDKNSYLENGILTSENIQKVWMEATKRRKRELSELPYLMVKTEKENDKPEKESGKPDNASTQQEVEQPKPLKEGKAAVGTEPFIKPPGEVFQNFDLISHLHYISYLEVLQAKIRIFYTNSANRAKTKNLNAILTRIHLRI